MLYWPRCRILNERSKEAIEKSSKSRSYNMRLLCSGNINGNMNITR